MKKILFTGWLLFIFCSLGFGQVDSAAVVKEVDSLIQVSRDLTDKRNFDKALEVSEAAEKLALEKLGRETAAYGAASLNHGRVHHLKGDYPTAEKWYLESRSVREKVLGKKHTDYAQTLNSLGALYWRMGNYNNAEPCYLEATSIREKALGKEHPDYANSLLNLGLLYWKMGNYEKAEPYYLEAMTIQEKVLGKDHTDYARTLNNLANLYWGIGNYEKSELLHFEAKAIRERALGKEHVEYVESLSNLAGIQVDMGTYEKAEPLYLEVKAIREKLLGKEHADYARTLVNLAVLYVRMGNYEKAGQLYLEAKAIREKLMGKEHPEYATVLNNLGILYWNTGNYEKAEPLFLESRDILEKKLGKEHTDLANTLNALATLYVSMHNYEKAEPIHLEAKAIREKALGKEHPLFAESLASLANLYGDLGNYVQAESLFLEVRTIREKTLGKGHQYYAQTLHSLGILYWFTGDYLAAQTCFGEANEIEKSLLIKSTRHLSEREINSYSRKLVDELNRNFSFGQKQPGTSAVCYDNTLFHKGFLLNAALQINKLALTDSATSENYNLLKSYHRRLAAEYAKPIAKRKNIAELEEKANALEKDLARTVSGFGEALRQVNWQEVQAALKPREAAIEFIRFDYYNPKPTDSVLYAALLLKPGMAAPAFISLFEEKQLDALLAPLAAQGSGGLNELYGGKAGQSLYRLLWSPLEPYLKGVKTVHFSPAGLLHRLNLDAIPTGKSRETIGKRHTLSALGSTRQLVVKPVAPATNTAAAVFGGIRYDMDSTAITASQPDELAGHRGLSFSQTDSTLRGGSWKYLKYSEREAGNIQAQLQKAGFQAGVHKGYAATEEAFKQLGKTGPSPRILHISTHGFFFPDPEANPQSVPRSRDRNLQFEEPVFKISDHPMIRSGLILAGANYAWSTGHPLGNREDGILTAYEISQMDLRHTELVVLSACETGLGDIRGNEGVYGLQRAFKIAGAKNLIMSLWQVPDLQTQELMTVFYQKWLDEKLTVHQALKAAQEEMQRRRYEPFYWAGFVLVE